MFTSCISDILLFLLFFSSCLLLCLLPALKQQAPPRLVSKNNVRFVSRNPWYVLATRSKNSAFSPCPTKPAHPPQTHTHTLAKLLLSAPLSLFILHQSPTFPSFCLSFFLPLSLSAVDIGLRVTVKAAGGINPVSLPQSDCKKKIIPITVCLFTKKNRRGNSRLTGVSVSLCSDHSRIVGIKTPRPRSFKV